MANLSTGPTDFRPYLDLELDELLNRLALVSAAIVDCSADVAEAKGTEMHARAEGWARSTEETVRAREKASQFNAVSAIETKIEAFARLEALKEEQTFLRFLIEVRTRPAVFA